MAYEWTELSYLQKQESKVEQFRDLQQNPLSAFVLGLSTIPFLINFFYSIFKGPKAPINPWKSTTLEWTVPSPPPHGNFETTPTVYHGPYEYSVPGMEEDYLPQNQPAPDTVRLAAH